MERTHIWSLIEALSRGICGSCIRLVVEEPSMRCWIMLSPTSLYREILLIQPPSVSHPSASWWLRKWQNYTVSICPITKVGAVTELVYSCNLEQIFVVGTFEKKHTCKVQLIFLKFSYDYCNFCDYYTVNRNISRVRLQHFTQISSISVFLIMASRIFSDFFWTYIQ